MRSGLPYRLVQLYVGLVVFGFSSALLVRSRLGLDPWDVLHQGIARHVGLQIGTVVIIVGALALLVWIPLRQRPGLGTISNMVLVGLTMDGVLDLMPRTNSLPLRWVELLVGVFLCGVASGMYIGAHFGPGPRDGLMTGLSRLTGLSIRVTRAALEFSVLVGGWLLGGTVGVGTVVFAASIGPLVQLFLRIFDTAAPVEPAPPTPPLWTGIEASFSQAPAE